MEDPIWPPEDRVGDTDSDRTARVRPGGVAAGAVPGSVPNQPGHYLPPEQPAPPPVPAPPPPGQFPAEGYPTAQYPTAPPQGQGGQPLAPWAPHSGAYTPEPPHPGSPPGPHPGPQGPQPGLPGYTPPGGYGPPEPQQYQPGAAFGQPPGAPQSGPPFGQPPGPPNAESPYNQPSGPPPGGPPFGQPPGAPQSGPPFGQPPGPPQGQPPGPPQGGPPFGQPPGPPNAQSPFGPPPGPPQAEAPFGPPSGPPQAEAPFGPPPGAPQAESPFGPPPGAVYGAQPGGQYGPPPVPAPGQGAFPPPGEYPPPAGVYQPMPVADEAPAPVSGAAAGQPDEAAQTSGQVSPAAGPTDDSPTPSSPWAQPIYRPNAAGNGPNGSGGQHSQEAQQPAEAGLMENQPFESVASDEVAPSSTVPSSGPPGPVEQPVYFPADPAPIGFPGLSQPAQPEPQPDQHFFDQAAHQPIHQPAQPPAEAAPQQLAPWQSTAQPQQQQPYPQQPYPQQQQQPYPQQQSYQQQQPYQQPPAAAYQNQPQQPPGAPAGYPEQPGTPGADEQGQYIPTAEEFARRREVRPSNPIATMGLRGALRRSTFGLMRPGPGKREQEHRHLIETIRRNFGGLRQVTVVNPKGGAGKTVAVLLLAMTFGQSRGGYVLSWDNNETQGTLGMRATQDFHSRTVRDLMRDLDHFQGAHGRVGDLSQYVRSQGEGMFDVLASDESATAGEMLTAMSFSDLREVVSRFYKLIFVDTGNNVRAENWQAAIDATDQLVVTMSARNDSAETAARMLDHLEQNGRNRLVRQAVTVVSMPPSRRDLDVPSITRHFSARTRTVMLAPYEKLIDSGEPIRYGGLSAPTRLAWLRIGAAVAEGL